MRLPAAIAGLILALACACTRTEPQPALPSPAAGAGELPTPESYAAITDPIERSRALFLAASRVLLHPRCANCHPDGDSPLQGMDGRPHDPPVTRGPDDHGVVGMQCQGCHQDHNLELARVPGAPRWHLAPLAMAWVGKSPHTICEQIKDPARNGGKDLQAIVDHVAHDELVAWGWDPGHGREPAPGTQARAGALMTAWLESGAHCPIEEARP